MWVGGWVGGFAAWDGAQLLLCWPRTEGLQGQLPGQEVLVQEGRGACLRVQRLVARSSKRKSAGSLHAPVCLRVAPLPWPAAPNWLPPNARRRSLPTPQGGPPLSWEGGEQRCFHDLFFCGEKIGTAKTARPGAARLEGGVPRELGAWGQELVAHVQQQQQEQATPQDGARGRKGGGASRRLKVLFLRRDSEGRQLLNAEELLQRCNDWRVRDPESGAALTAECRQVSRGGAWPAMMSHSWSRHGHVRV